MLLVVKTPRLLHATVWAPYIALDEFRERELCFHCRDHSSVVPLIEGKMLCPKCAFPATAGFEDNAQRSWVLPVSYWQPLIATFVNGRDSSQTFIFIVYPTFIVRLQPRRCVGLCIQAYLVGLPQALYLPVSNQVRVFSGTAILTSCR
jgi:hypothetical protein